MSLTNEILQEIEDQEKDLKLRRFLTPIYRGGKVRINVYGFPTILTIKTPPRLYKDQEFGWAVIRPTSSTTAVVVRKPSEEEVREYINHLPKVSFILAKEHEGIWFGFPAYNYHSDLGNLSTFNLRQISDPLELPQLWQGTKFDHVLTRYDGRNFWYTGIDYKRHPAIADYLRKSLKLKTPIEDLHFKTLTPQEKQSYQLTLELEKEPVLRMLERAVVHGGGTFESYIDRGDSYMIHFTVDGEEVRTTVKKDLQVISAGFCLNGRDSDFDLTSLVSVVREGQEEDRLERDYD